MTEKWTPGPWRKADYDVPPRYLHALPPMVLIRSAAPKDWWVALATMDSGDRFPASLDERDANASLIAAAPELYRALQAIVNSMDYGCPNGIDDERPLMHAAREALVTARTP